MHGLRTIERMNRDNTEAARIIAKYGGDVAGEKAYQEMIDRDIKEAQERIRERQK